MKKAVYILLAVVLAMNTQSCKKEDTVTSEEQAAIDDAIIKDYIATNGYTASEVGGGVYVQTLKIGTGPAPTSMSVVKVRYKGYLIDGTVFDETTTGIEFGLDQVIQGWQIGVPYINAGGSGRLFIPSGRAYGTQAVGEIPANSVLIFEIDVISTSN